MVQTNYLFLLDYHYLASSHADFTIVSIAEPGEGSIQFEFFGS